MNFGRVAAALFLVVLALACSARAGGEAEVHADDDRRAADAADDRSVPAGDPCDFDVLDDASSVPAGQGPLAVGKFVVRLEGGSVFVEHESEPGRVLFATPGGVLVGAAAVSLEVTEGQGSFQVKEVVKHRCGGAADEVRWDGLRLRLDGVLGGACSGQRFTWRFCNPLPNHLRFEIELGEGGADAVFLQARADDDERFYGMGEQFARDTLDLRGRVVPVVVQEGGVGRGEEKASQFMETVSPGSSGSEAATYYPVPHYVSSLDRSLFLEGESISVFDFGQGGVVEVRGYARRMAGRILFGGSPLELVERFTEYAGRMRPLPAWAGEGAVVALARELPESLEIVDELLSRGVRIAGVWNQTWCGKAQSVIGEQVLWNWARNLEANPGWSEFVEALGGKGIRVLCYVNPMFRDPPDDVPVERNLFEEGIAGGYFVRNGSGEVYLQKVTAFDVALLDLSSEEAREWMKGVIRAEMVEKAGCRGWMADFGEALPLDAVMASGETGEQWHNRYPVEWARLNREAVMEAGLEGEALVFSRSGFTTTPGEALLLWQGDQLTTWDRFDGMASALHGLLEGGFSGIALNHSDVGGYTSLSFLGKEYERDEELLLRWAEMNAFGPLLRTHEGNAPGQSMQVYGSESAMAGFARMTQVFAALAPYREALFAEAAEKGWPVVRHLAMHYPDDGQAWEVDDQFLLGSELLVAPILEPCGDGGCERAVYLPEGAWVHLWTGVVHAAPRDGSFVSAPAPLGQPPVFYRDGSAASQAIVEAFSDAGLIPLE